MTPAVRRPYSAGSTPVSRLIELGEARTQHLSEAGDALGKLDPIYPVLKIGVVSAYVDRSVRILRDARRLQYHLVEGRIRALRQLLDRLLG